MSECTTQINQWLPVVGTAIGAIIGFAGAFGTTLFSNNAQNAAREKELRRERIEEIYLHTQAWFNAFTNAASHGERSEGW